MPAEAALREVAPDLWVAEEPLCYFGYEMGRRMAVVRLADSGLLIHSPIALTAALRRELDALGNVRFVVPASNLHGHLYMEQYRDTYPDVRLFSAPGLESKRADLNFDGELRRQPDPGWVKDLDQTTFEGHYRLTEIEFFHRKTRTLITGDLCFNIGDDWPLATKELAWGQSMRRRLGPTTVFREGITDTNAARLSLGRILRWDFERILPGHGEILDTSAKARFDDAFAWLLG